MEWKNDFQINVDKFKAGISIGDNTKRYDKSRLTQDISLESLINMSLNEEFTRKGFIHPFSFICDF